MFTEKQTLIVVYKDELVFNQLKKLVETNDDTESGGIVGTEDGSVDIVAWDEKHWLDNKEAGTINSKVLLIGKIKGAENLEPVIDVKYENKKWGIKYGWAGKQALILVDENVISKEEYQKFLKEFKSKGLRQKKKNIYKESIKKVAVSSILGLPASLIYDYYNKKSELRQQLLLYGILHLYENNLEKFMKS